MAYFYVKSGLGTRATGGGTTKQTGSFTALGAANVYAKITDAIADGASDSDIICCSDSHALSTSTAQTYTGGTSAPLHIMSVADANCDQYSAGATEDITGGASDVFISGIASFLGVTIKTEDLFLLNAGNVVALFEQCNIAVGNANNQIQLSADGSSLILNDCDIDFELSSSYIYIGYGCHLAISGCTFSSTTTGSIINLLDGGFINGGGNAYICSTDLSLVTGYLAANFGSALGADDFINIHIDKCKLNASLTGFHNETFVNKNHKLLVTNSSSSSAAAEYQYYFHTRGGTVEDDTSFYRDGSTAFADSAQKVSLKCVTDAAATQAMPFEFEFPTTFAALSSASTDTLRIYILTAATLTDADVWAIAYYPDGTNKQTFNTIKSVANPTDPMRTGTTLTTNTEAWTGRTTENRYQIDLDTSSDAGADCVPKIMLYVAKASTTIYFCTTVEVVA